MTKTMILGVAAAPRIMKPTMLTRRKLKAFQGAQQRTQLPIGRVLHFAREH